MFELRFVVLGINQAIRGITAASHGGSYYGAHTSGLLLHLPTVFENDVLSQLPTFIRPPNFRT